MATRPASMPLHIIEVSGFMPLIIIQNMAPKRGRDAGQHRVDDDDEMRRSVPARVEPGLKPNQPKARMNVPITTIGMLWPGKACGLPLTYLPMRGPIARPPARAMIPPMACTTPEPAKSTAPCPKPQFLPAWASQPPPHTQLAIDAVGQRDPQAVEAEILPSPALGHRAGGNRGRGVHEHHHEEEQRHDADVVDAVQEEALGPSRP